MHVTKTNYCRGCGTTKLKEVIDLGDQCIQGAFKAPGDDCVPTRTVPLKLVRCCPDEDENACGLLQLSHTVPQEILYQKYWYRSGVNQTMTDHLKGIADLAIEMTAGNNGAGRKSVLDIGCNDGTLLRAFPSDWGRMGVEPSNAFDTLDEFNKEVKVVKDVFPTLHPDVVGLKFDVITSIAMFYDLNEPAWFALKVKELLKDNGVWIVEVSYMPSMLKNNSFDTICHEHLEYYSLASLEFICKKVGLRVLRAQLNDSNGGSIRCVVCHEKSFMSSDTWTKEISDIRMQEFNLALDTDKPYLDFSFRISKIRSELRDLIRQIVSSGGSIHIYGASTKGNTIIQYLGITSNVIQYAADRNPIKHGATCIGSGIKIISEKESREMMPTHYLVLPWHFKKEFLEREVNVMGKGTKMIFPLPRVEIAEII